MGSHVFKYFEHLTPRAEGYHSLIRQVFIAHLDNVLPPQPSEYVVVLM